MFTKITRRKRSHIEVEIDNVLDIMTMFNPGSEEYSTMSENLERLYKAKAHESDRRLSPDTIAVIAGNLLGIGLILLYEKADIITTKALGFIIKGRV